MMTVKAELLNLVETVAEQVGLPPVDWVYIPEPDPGPGRHTEFGIVTLRDGSAGLYYAWLGASQKGMGSRYDPVKFSGVNPVELARWCAGDDEADCSLGLPPSTPLPGMFSGRQTSRQVMHRIQWASWTSPLPTTSAWWVISLPW